MSGVPLSTVLEHNYLGIFLHHKLSWDPHINFICSKASQLLGFLKRALRTAPLEIKGYLYKQLLLPSIEYCSVIWDPHHSTSIYKLEMIQHRAARFVLNKPWLRSAQQENSSVTDMLQWRIQHSKKGGSTTTQMHSQALPDSWHSNLHNAPYK